MIKAVLLDLDNTLIHNRDSDFVTAYLQSLDRHFHEHHGIKSVAEAVLAGLRLPKRRADDVRTNHAVMLNHLSLAVQRSPSELDSAFGEFYRREYPALKECTQALGDLPARLIRSLRDRDIAVVIATNPVYPAAAIEQRMQWAGLPHDPDTYALVTHAENMHYAKPDLAYFAEIIARVGVEPDEAVMIGDNPHNDIAAATAAGLHSIWSSTEPHAGAATLAALYETLIESEWLDHPPHIRLQSPMIEPELRGNLGALFGTIANARASDWSQHPIEEEWSPWQIISHLHESERIVQRPRLMRILAEENPFLISPAPPRGPYEAWDYLMDGHHTAQAFAKERAETIDWLLTLPDSDWQRPARHSIFGHTSLLEMAHFTAQHDRLHIKQLCQTLGKCT